MIEEAAVDVSGNNLEWITAEPFFTKISIPDISLYPAMTGYQFFGLKKKMKKGLRVMIKIEIYFAWKLWYL